MALLTLSIRWRIIVSTMVIVGALWTLLSVFLCVETWFAARQKLDLEVRGELMEATRLMDLGVASGVLEAFIAAEKSILGEDRYFLQVLDAQGRLLVSCDDLAQDALCPMKSDELDEVPHPLPGHEGEKVRLLEREVETDLDGSGKAATVRVRVALSTRSCEEETREAAKQAALALLVALAGVAVMSWLVTSRSLAPVRSLTATASRISAHNPQERLPLSGSGDEVDELALVLNGMLERLHRALRQMEDFTSDAAHQLRTPLTRIRGELDLVLRDEVPEHLRMHIESVREEVQRLSATCTRLLLLARLDQRGVDGRLSGETVQLDELVEELVEQMRPLAQEKGMTLELHPGPSCRVAGSKHLISEAILNLLHNAVQFTPVGGRIRVGLESRAGRVQVAIDDSGPGVPEQEREKIFQRFHRILPSDGASTEGTGLGLAIVRGIARAHGGTVEVEGLEPAGSRFLLVLPLSG